MNLLALKSTLRMAATRFRDALGPSCFARKRDTGTAMPHSLVLTQPFMPSPTLEAKKHNLREAARLINRVTVMPDETFSFWRIVGNPNDPSRFVEGRSIRAGVATTDRGGGLCQISGIIHHAALLAGWKVTERHNHSIDLYTDETRFAPLGTDATVFYGFKDLRIVNDTPAPLKFHIDILPTELKLTVTSSLPITTLPLDISLETDPSGTKHVTVSRSGRVVSTSRYLPLPSR